LSAHSPVSDSPSSNDVRRMTLATQEAHFLVWRQWSEELRPCAFPSRENGSDRASLGPEIGTSAVVEGTKRCLMRRGLTSRQARGSGRW
jgi:hypothetical protein